MYQHGSYGLGGVLAPIIATAMITRANLGWWTFSYVILGALVLELGFAAWAFRAADGAVFQAEHPSEDAEAGNSITGIVLRNKIVWICAAFLLV